MSRILKLSAAVVLGGLVLAQSAAAGQRMVIVRPGPVFFGGYGYGYGPWAYGYGYGPAYYGYPVRNTGEVKILTHRKDASVYIDGGYAGLTGKLKKFALGPGNHDIELRDNGGKTIFHEKVRILVGKTTEITL
jgi:hypothetical protein